jgi:hypothetical protein
MTQEVFYRPHRDVLCKDGVKRTAHVRSYWDGRRWCAYGDTYFSVPAFVYVRGKTVRGYVGSDDGVEYFRATLYHKNHAMIVEKPAESAA